jgi:hypothetical protein
MNLRCIYCQTPFTLSRMEKLIAIQHLQAENLHHHDAFCPRCRRSNPVSIDRLRIFTPGWQEGLRTLEADVAEHEKETTPVAAPVAAPAKPAPAAKKAPAKKRHSSAAEKKAAADKAAKAKSAAKKPVKKAPAKPASKAKKPATKSKSK